jgi:hypothetical protein
MRPARLAAPLLGASLALLAGSCGGGGAGDRAARALPSVRMHVIAPIDSATTGGTSVTVRGRVDPPDASVRILGVPAEVVAGTFSASVDLDPGANVIDLAATAPGHGPALTAVRVMREMPIRLPDLSGLTADAARKRVEALGLRFESQDAGGLFEKLLPGDPGVCQQDPSPGADAKRGSTVRVYVAKRC